MTDRASILKRIEDERQRQLDMFGSEYDRTKSPNDWITTINHYVSEHITKNGMQPTSEDIEDSFVKAGAVILAALEHIDVMFGDDE